MLSKMNLLPNNIYICSFVLLFRYIGALSLDEVCVTGEVFGSCQLISECPYAVDLLRKGQYPDTCGFEGIEQIVCCPFTANYNKKPAKSAAPTLVNLEQELPTTTKQFLSEKKCEEFYPKPDLQSFVTGGVKSLAKEFPHMAIIGYGNESNIKWGCGGSLISLNFVMTAGHCLESSDFGFAKWVRLGDLDLSTKDDVAEPQDFTVKRRILHPQYEPPSRYNDIALLELDRKVALTNFVSPACLATENTPSVEKMTATGWGKTEFVGESSFHLLKVDLDRVDIQKCRKSFESTSRRFLPIGIQKASHLCAGGVVGKDTCQGDSGGPLQVKNEERSFFVNVHTLFGVTSFGKACGLSPTPGVYTRVAFYVPWIESVVWPDEN